MANPSPIVTVQDGGGGQQATTNGAVVTAGNVVTVTLSSVASVGVWSLTVVGQDDLVTPPVITVNNVAKTATFTAPALPWSLVLQSQVGINSLGKDVNGQTQPSYTTTLGIYCTTAGGARLLATNERAEGSAAYGWITKINTLIRTPAGGGSVPTGTGLPHITAGAQDAAAIHGTVAGQILAVNAGVTDVAFVGVSQDATLSSAGALAVGQLSGFAGVLTVPTAVAVKFGTNPATVGDLRLKYNWTMYSRNAANSADVTIIQSGTSSNDLYVGDQTNVGAARLWASTTAGIAVGGNSDYMLASVGSGFTFFTGGGTQLAVASATISCAAPIVGSGTAWGSVNGVGTQAMADANQTPSSAVYQSTGILFTGADTLLRAVTMPTATNTTAYAKWMSNQTTGGFGLTIQCTAGTTQSLGSLKSAWFWFDASGVRKMTADF